MFHTLGAACVRKSTAEAVVQALCFALCQCSSAGITAWLFGSVRHKCWSIVSFICTESGAQEVEGMSPQVIAHEIIVCTCGQVLASCSNHSTCESVLPGSSPSSRRSLLRSL